jgi:hypothetical protein
MPSWRQGQTVGEWRQIPGTALSGAPIAVKTWPGVGVEGPEAKVTSWNGFAIDTRDSSLYSVANGGHWAYAGNEVNRVRLQDDAPKWTEQRASTPAAQIIDSVSHYADGRPTSRHTYYGTMIHEGRNRAMLVGGSRFGNGWPIDTVDGFNLGSSDWDAARTYPNFEASLSQVIGAAMTMHAQSGDIYAFPYFAVLKWSNATNQWSKPLPNTPFDGQYAASAFDSRRNRILLVGGGSGAKAIYDVSANTMQAASLSGPAAASVMGDGNGMVYDPQQDAYFVRKAGAGPTVYRINAGTLYVESLATTGGASIPSAINGVWRRFLYVPALKGIVYVPAYGANVWFLRTN